MKCEHIKHNNKKCNAQALANDKYCYMHSKQITEAERNRHRSAGGKHKQIKINPEVISFDNYELNNMKDVLKLNAVLINSVLQNKIDLKIATGICYLLNMQLKGIEMHLAESRKRENESLFFNPVDPKQREIDLSL